jgi:hypothetical protein
MPATAGNKEHDNMYVTEPSNRMALAVVAAANNGDSASHALAQALQFATAV